MANLVFALGIAPVLGVLAQEVRPELPPSSTDAPAAVSSIISLLGHRPEALGAVFSPDGKWLITTGADRMVAMRDPLTGAIRGTLRGHTNRVYRAAVSPDSTILASTSGDGTVRVWSIERGEQIGMFNAWQERPVAARAVAMSPRGDIVASGADDGIIKLWSIKDNKEVAMWESQPLPVASLAFSSDGAVLVSATGDWRNYQQPGDVRLWEVASGKRLASLPGFTNEIKCVAIDADGKYLATSSSNRLVQLWNLTSREELAKMRLQSAGTSLSFSPDGARLAIGENSGGVSTLSVPTLRQATRYTGHTKTVSGIAFSPDGKRLASAGHDGVVSLWPVSTPDSPTK